MYLVRHGSATHSRHSADPFWTYNRVPFRAQAQLRVVILVY